MFQHTAARRRLLAKKSKWVVVATVSTHSRPKAAALFEPLGLISLKVSTHSRPKAAAPYIKK